MSRVRLLAGAALALTSALALAQGRSESLLPTGFDKPAPRATPQAASATPRIDVEPVIAASPDAADRPAAARAPEARPEPRVPSVADLKALPPDELSELLGIQLKVDIPPAARRAMSRVGVIDASEGGLPGGALARQSPVLVAAAIKGNKGPMVSRWGHILVRRALASRLDAPQGMAPADFAAMRAALLVRMGEGDAARALVQDVDTGNYTPDLTQAALDAYVATADFTGLCPAVALQGNARKDGQWRVFSAICQAFRGEGNAALSQLDRSMSAKDLAQIDVLLAQKYAGAAGKARRAVKIEWDKVGDMTPLRFALTIAVGLQPPESLMRNAPARLDAMAATAPMAGLPMRAAAADRAAAMGILSSAAMIDLYSQIYAQSDIGAPWSERAGLLRTAYVGDSAQDRLAAIKALWEGAPGETRHYARQVLTAHAAARLPVSKDYAGDSAALVASMLAAGLDGNALRWAPLAEVGSETWGLLALAAPQRATPVEAGAVSSFSGNDDSEGSRKTAFLLAGLAGLGRIAPETTRELGQKLDVDLFTPTRWTRAIDQAAEVNNPALVALLAGMGMQGTSWQKMTPRHLFHIVSALNRVGFEAEARMIAAEAVARG